MLISVLLTAEAHSSPMRYLTVNTTKAKALGMGGAFMAQEDNLAALAFNPAGFRGSGFGEKWNFSVSFNALAPAVVLRHRGHFEHWTTPLGWVIGGCDVTVGSLHMGIRIGEEALSGQAWENAELFKNEAYDFNNNTTLGIAFKLAPRVSIGAAGDLFLRKTAPGAKKLDLGYRYGIIVKPRSNLSVGLCYIDLPNRYNEDRMVLDRLADETLNIGADYSPFSWIQVAIDVRNVSDEEKGADREPHIGMALSPWKHLEVYGGFYRILNTHANVYSFGLALLDWNRFLPVEKRCEFPTFLIQTSMVMENRQHETVPWFIMSAVLRW